MLCRFERPIAGLMRHLVGEDHNTVRIFDLRGYALFILTEYPNIHPMALCFSPVLFTQSVHSANQYNTHNVPL